MKSILNSIRSFISDPFQQSSAANRESEYLTSICARISEKTGDTYCARPRLGSRDRQQFEIIKL